MTQTTLLSLRSNIYLSFHPFKTWSHSALIFVFLALACNGPTTGASDPEWATDPAKQNSVTADFTPELNGVCDYHMYVDFNDAVAESKNSATPYNKAVGKIYLEHPHATQAKPKMMDPKHLCIRTDARKNIDVNEFDCLPEKTDIEQVKGYCGCGSRWSQIDLNDNRTYLGLNQITHSYEYYALNGLDKFLVLEKTDESNFECVASRFGHCTLDEFKENTKWNITKCQKGFKCRNISVWSPIQKTAIYNSHTGEWYGLCISEKTSDGLRDPYSSSVKVFSNMSSIFIPAIIVIILTCQNGWVDNTENYKCQNNKCHSKFIR